MFLGGTCSNCSLQLGVSEMITAVTQQQHTCCAPIKRRQLTK
jgi:hypothetical protein